MIKRLVLLIFSLGSLLIGMVTPLSAREGDISDDQYCELSSWLLRKYKTSSGKWGAKDVVWNNVYPDGQHAGVDYGTACNKIPVYSVADGVVTARIDTMGLLCIYNSIHDVTFSYMHLSAINVMVGEEVSQGKKIGNVGNAGTKSIHLHFDARKGKHFFASPSYEASVNPYEYASRAHDIGRILIVPQFDHQWVRSFSDGMAAVKVGDKTGFIDMNGDMVIPPRFQFAGDFKEGLASFGSGKLFDTSKVGVMDRKGNTVIEPVYAMVGDFIDGIAWAIKDSKSGYIDKHGNVIIPFMYKALHSPSDNYGTGVNTDIIPFNYEDKWGYMHKNGEIIINPKYTDAYPFVDGLARVNISGTRCGYINKSGIMVIQAIYIPMGSSNDHYVSGLGFSEGLADVCIRDVPPRKYAYIDKTGNMVIGSIFDYATSFREGLALVRMGDVFSGNGQTHDGLWGYINKKGDIVIRPQYHKASSFKEGLAAVCMGNCLSSGKWGYINKNGDMIISPQYDYASPFCEGLARVKKSNKWFFISR